MDLNEQHAVSELTAGIVSAYVGNNVVSRENMPALITDIYSALVKAPTVGVEPTTAPQEPAVPVRKSVTPDHIVCLEDGKKFKSLKSHLNNEHGLTPQEYREKWGLTWDYPMVAPKYAKARSELARAMGLGRKAAGASPKKSSKRQAPRRSRRAKAARARSA
jgi:predicted transcriptional regulator